MTTLQTRDRATAPEKLAESKPAARNAAPPQTRVFLSPRVLDAAAFSEYAGSLKSLIQDLDERSARLKGANTDSDRIATALRETTAQLKQRAQAGAAIAKRLESQLSGADRALAMLKAGFGDEKTIALLVEEALVNRQAAIDHAIAQRFASLESRMRDAEKRAADAEARAEAADERLARLARSLTALNEQADTIDDRTSETLAAAESTAEHAAGKALEALEQLRVLADEVRRNAADETVSIESRFGPVRDLLASATEILGSPGNPGTLQRAIDLARARTVRLATLNETTTRNIESAATTEESIADAVNAAAESLESLRARKTELVDAIDQEVESLSEEISPIERAAASLAGMIDDLTDRTRDLHAQIQAAATAITDAEGIDPNDLAAQKLAHTREAAEQITNQALRQVEEAAEWLAALAAQTHPPQPIHDPNA
jgi:chromosome segregation ATPase